MNRATYWMATKRQWNVANAVTLSRAVAVAFIPAGILLGEEWLGLLVLYAAGSDWLDGWLARKFRQETPIGVVADPLADKVFTDIFLVYATVITESWWVAVLAGVTMLYDIDNTYQRRFDIANAFKGVPVTATKPTTLLSKSKTVALFGFMFTVLYPQLLLVLSVDEFALMCTIWVLCSWVYNRQAILGLIFRQ